MRVRAAAEIEAEKQRAIADLRAEVADLALAAAGRVVGETMNDERQRRLVQEFLAGTADGRLGELMARRDTAARRYAEAAFEVAMRDGTVETWRTELDAAAELARATSDSLRTLANPAIAASRPRTTAAEATFGVHRQSSRPEPHPADAPARTDRPARRASPRSSVASTTPARASPTPPPPAPRR